MKHRFASILLGALTCLMLIAAGTGEAYIVVNNKANLSYTNIAQVFYYSSSDSVDIYVYAGPSMSLTKLTQNLRTGEQGSNTNTIPVVPGDTVEITLFSQNTGDSAAYYVMIIDTFPVSVGDPTSGNSMNYVVGSETCAIDGSLPADSISWSTDAGHTWSAWQAYSDAVSSSIPNTCTGIRWEWSRIVCSDENEIQSQVKVKFKWFRNNN